MTGVSTRGEINMFEGSKEARILFVSDFLRTKEVEAGLVLAGERRDILINALHSAGIVASDYSLTVIHPTGARGNKITGFTKEERIEAQLACKKLINESKANVIVPLGEYALKFITGLDGIQKQHLSILPTKAEFGARKAVPLLHTEMIQRSYGDVAYIRFGAMRIKEEMSSTLLNIPERKIRLSLDMGFEEQVGCLEHILKHAIEVSTDVETGNGSMNTVGFATSPGEAVVIEALPSGKSIAEFHKLWDLFRQIWESESIGKIAQHSLFESTWASVYGIQLNAVSFDTMWAMKFLHPTLERGLDNVGRIYTRFPYWKDDHSDWNNVRNWRSHLEYCGKDVTGQFAAKQNQEKALKARGMHEVFTSFIMRQFPLAQEMESRGFNLDTGMLETMKHNALRDIEAVTESFDKSCEERLKRKINVNSPKQVKDALKEIGLRIPTHKGKETTGRGAMMKLKNKYPKEMIVRDLIKIDQLKRKTEEFLNFNYDPDGRVRYSFDLANDEAGVWVGKKTIFDKGFDATQVPSIVRNCIISDPGKTFVQIRLNQPEIRFIAKDAPDYKLQELLSNHADVSRFLAGKLFRKSLDMVNRNEMNISAQVIKSTNEFDSPKQFVEKCFARASVFFQDAEAKRMMQIFLEEFSGCRKRIERITKEMYSKRMLGSDKRQITYYDRVNDTLVRRALAWGPESYSNDCVTEICLLLQGLGFIEFITRNKNSILIQVDEGKQFDMIEHVSKYSNMIEISTGSRWGSLSSV
jgi:DNA polymerase I-like protein with 3'-5' exonuclease and polymerase domains/uracil-DNA glycosylase